ncbi:hypothetical protein [Scytonema sp. PRP1]|jgi:hypothetical protein|uniref:hypothetical protein n=1 Tax=Scytonema sp. PRP1 TaxID=3120513 RepID=UPI00300CD67E
MTVSYPYLANYWFAASRLDKLIPIAEYANATHVHVQTVRRRILQGRLIGLKTGGKWYVLRPIVE